MPVPAATPHTAAVIALLQAALPAAVTVHDGDVPDTPGQTYVAVYDDAGNLSATSLAAVTDYIAQTVQVTCVGTTPAQARMVLDAVRAALIDQRPTVAGRSCWRIAQQDGMPTVARDDEARDPVTNRPRFYYTPRFVIASVPA